MDNSIHPNVRLFAINPYRHRAGVQIGSNLLSKNKIYDVNQINLICQVKPLLDQILV